ncbi:Os04g0563000 [Oryza sativa Japonica Group]|uniref:Os04g0563000 protein n=1 Tax=Oryza sativa subsp. japonica TaxID=39947 RepID=Q0JB12_ORYSJ|nr:Os04g0563000 [Oryza sativa Japonica Group]|eukprot:NP_001053561.2 Os04g0563000 [Oryza sativa Japonica Group]
MAQTLLIHTCCDRFEPDMLAFSGCYFGGGEIERRELGAIRKRWKTLHVREYPLVMFIEV